MSLFWPEAHLVLSFRESERDRTRSYPADVLVLHVSRGCEKDEEFVDRIRRLILMRTHYLEGRGPLPDSLKEPCAHAIIRLLVRGQDHVIIEE